MIMEIQNSYKYEEVIIVLKNDTIINEPLSKSDKERIKYLCLEHNITAKKSKDVIDYIDGGLEVYFSKSIVTDSATAHIIVNDSVNVYLHTY